MKFKKKSSRNINDDITDNLYKENVIPYVIPWCEKLNFINGVPDKIKVLYSIGEQRDNYYLTGIPDGLGAYSLDEDNIRLLINSEISLSAGYPYYLKNGFKLTGARISYLDFNKYKLKVYSSGLSYEMIYNFNYKKVSKKNPLTIKEYINNGQRVISTQQGLDRLCSGSLYIPYYWNEERCQKRGFKDLLYIVAEESGCNGTTNRCKWSNSDFLEVPKNKFGDVVSSSAQQTIPINQNIYTEYAYALNRGSLFWVLDIKNKNLWAIPKMGRGCFENTVLIDTKNDTHIALFYSMESKTTDGWAYNLQSPSLTNPYDSRNGNIIKTNYSRVVGGAPLLIYIGKKNNKVCDKDPLKFLERNGLKDGKVYVGFIEGTSNELSPTQITTNIKFVQFNNFEDNICSFYNTIRNITPPTGYSLFMGNKIEDMDVNPKNGLEIIYCHEPKRRLEYLKLNDLFSNNLDNEGYPIELNGICNIFYQFTSSNSKPDNIAWTNKGLFICEDNSFSTIVSNDTINKIWHLTYQQQLNNSFIVDAEQICKVEGYLQYDLQMIPEWTDQPEGFDDHSECSGLIDLSPFYNSINPYNGKEYRNNLNGEILICGIQAHGLISGKISRKKLAEGGQLFLIKMKY